MACGRALHTRGRLYYGDTAVAARSEMAKIPFDNSFVRDGRSLADWLPELVSDDKRTRFAAAEALGGMRRGTPQYSTDVAMVDWPSSAAIVQQQERFDAAARAAVEGESFPKVEFVKRLIRYRIALDEGWQRETARSSNIQLARGESLEPPGMLSSAVFKSLDRALLAHEEGLWTMLQHDGSLHYDALAALARIGPPALEFADFLFERLDRQKDSHRFDGVEALAGIGQGNAKVVDALLTRLRNDQGKARSGAAEVLERMGPPLAGRADEAVEVLLGMTKFGDPRQRVYGAVSALASLGREREDALIRVLDLASPRPPQWDVCEGFPDYRFDRTMMARGEAINALPYFARFADRVVPVLLGAFESFHEYDPDYAYDGEHGRVCEALSRFGAAAAPAVGRLIEYLKAWDSLSEKETPKDVFGLLAAIGPAAAEALPLLERIRENQHEAPDELFDEFCPLDNAILAIRGAPS